MIIEPNNNKPKSHLYAPERDYNEIDEGVEIIKEHFKKWKNPHYFGGFSF